MSDIDTKAPRPTPSIDCGTFDVSSSVSPIEDPIEKVIDCGTFDSTPQEFQTIDEFQPTAGFDFTSAEEPTLFIKIPLRILQGLMSSPQRVISISHQEVADLLAAIADDTNAPKVDRDSATALLQRSGQ